MPTKIIKNSFQGGMDKDTDPKQIKNINYSDGFNVSLSQDGNYQQLSSFNGTTALSSVLAFTNYTNASQVHIMGMYDAEYLLDGTATDFVLVFLYNENTTATAWVTSTAYTVGNERTNGGLDYICIVAHTSGTFATDLAAGKWKLTGKFSIFAVKVSDGTVYTQYTESIGLAEKDRYVDAVIYKEGGVTYAYFTDAETPIKKLPCEITTAGLGDATEYQRSAILLIRKGFRGLIDDIVVNVNDGGDLICGSYQFAWRLLDNSTNKYTKWSLLTNPIPISAGWSQATLSGDFLRSFGGVGYISTQSIELDLILREDHTSGTGDGLYSHYQVAVIENTNGLSDRTQIFKALQPEAIFATTTTYKYKTNDIAQFVDTVDELTVDDAAILAVKSLAIKHNRLIAGGIVYHDLDYDNNEPEISNATVPNNKKLTSLIDSNGVSTTTVQDTRTVGYRDPNNAANFVSYFRDELYRFAISYYDEFGNYSQPKILDFSTVTVNSTSGDGIDYRFPPRNNSKYGVLIRGAADNETIQGLGLSLKGIKNHPSWAKGFVILRAPRKKKILFQTPVVPSILVQPAKAIGDYPAQRRNDKGEELELLNVEVANPKGSFLPKNFFHILTKSMIRFSDFYGVDTSGLGEVYITVRYFGNTNIVIDSERKGLFESNTGVTEKLLYNGSIVDSLVIRYGSVSATIDFDGTEEREIDVTLYSRTRGTENAWTIVGTADANYRSTTTLSSIDLTVNDYLLSVSENSSDLPSDPTFAKAKITTNPAEIPFDGWDGSPFPLVSWKFTQDFSETGFKIDRDEDGAGYTTPYITLTDPYLRSWGDEDANLPENSGKTYQYRIYAFNPNGDSGKDETNIVTTP